METLRSRVRRCRPSSRRTQKVSTSSPQVSSRRRRAAVEGRSSAPALSGSRCPGSSRLARVAAARKRRRCAALAPSPTSAASAPGPSSPSSPTACSSSSIRRRLPLPPSASARGARSGAAEPPVVDAAGPGPSSAPAHRFSILARLIRPEDAQPRLRLQPSSPAAEARGLTETWSGVGGPLPNGQLAEIDPSGRRGEQPRESTAEGLRARRPERRREGRRPGPRPGAPASGHTLPWPLVF